MVVVVLVVALVVYALVRPVPRLAVTAASGLVLQIPGAAPKLAWPAQGQAAAAVQGIGSFASFGSTNPTPMASLTKLMTALVVVANHRLAPPGPGVSDGPTVSFNSLDVTIWAQEHAVGDSVVQVAAGEVLTERQMLEALLIPSADNIADKLAVWDAGTQAAFVGKMNTVAAQLGLAATHYADASGLDPKSVSTPQDEIKVAEALMANPALASIVGTAAVQLPVAGLVKTFTPFLGQNGIVGVKTGLTDQAGGCAVLAARRRVGPRTFTVYAAVMGQQAIPAYADLAKAANAAAALLDSVESSLKESTVIPAGRIVGQVSSAWGAHAPAATTAPIQLAGWPGLTVSSVFDQQRLGASVSRKQRVGILRLTLDSQRAQAAVESTAPVSGPSWLWRIEHPF